MLLSHMESYNLRSIEERGFQYRRSSSTNLLITNEDWTTALYNG